MQAFLSGRKESLLTATVVIPYISPSNGFAIMNTGFFEFYISLLSLLVILRCFDRWDPMAIALVLDGMSLCTLFSLIPQPLLRAPFGLLPKLAEGV